MKVEGGAETASKKVDAGKEKKQKKIWGIVLACLGVAIVGLVTAIIVVKNVQDSINCRPMSDFTEEEIEQMQTDVELDAYNIIHEAIDRIIEATNNLEEEDVVKAYEYYISETGNTAVRNMLRTDLLTIEMSYDTEKTRGDELIAVAKEIDSEEQSVNSAALVINMAAYYGKNDVLYEYSKILAERDDYNDTSDDGGEG